MANRSRAATELFLLTTFGISVSLVYSVLNLEELNSIQYGFEILSEPVLMKEASDVGNTLLVSSKHGQQYQCKLPKLVNEENLSDEAQSISHDEIPRLLEPMKKKCLYNNKGWWTYEVCFGKGIYQYHEEGHQIVGEKISLGIFSSETDWSQEKILVDAKPAKKPDKSTKAKRFHSQYYVNGSKCDLTGKPRETQIKFFCEEGSADIVSRVDEPSSCQYVITINTNKLCKFSLFKSTPTHTAKSITCSPALSEDRYKMYIDRIEADKKAKEEAVAKAYAKQKRRTSKLDLEDEIEEDDDKQSKTDPKTRKTRRSQVWPWEDPGVEHDDELWIDGNIGQDQIGIHRLDIRKGRRRPEGGDEGDSITIVSQKVKRDKLPDDQREDKYIAKDDEENVGKMSRSNEKRKLEEASHSVGTSVTKEGTDKDDQGMKEQGEDSETEEAKESTEKKPSQEINAPNAAKQLDRDSTFTGKEFDEKWIENIHKAVLKMRTALKDKLSKMGVNPEVLERNFQEKLGDPEIPGKSVDTKTSDVDTGTVDKDKQADKMEDENPEMEQIDKMDKPTVNDPLVEGLQEMSNYLTKDLMEGIVDAAAAGQESLEKQFAGERAKMRREVELTRTVIQEIEETERKTGVKNEKQGKTISKTKETIERLEKTSKQLESDITAMKELNKEILDVAQDKTIGEMSDLMENLFEMSAKANKVVNRVILESLQLEQDRYSVKKMREDLSGHPDKEGKESGDATPEENDDLRGNMGLIINKLGSMIQNLEKGEWNSKEASPASSNNDEGVAQANSDDVESDSTSTSEPNDEDDAGSRVKVRVSKVRKITTDEETGLDEESDFDENEMEELGINKKLQQATKKMEELVKQQLKDSGVSSAGKIRVKIVTSKEAFKNLDAKSEVKLLSEREENQFTDMILGLLGGSLEAGKERRRQKSLENNYNLVWNEDKLEKVQREEEDTESEVEIESF